MFPDNISSVLVNGNRLEMESILFQCAIYYAEQGLNIWFISPEQFTQLPDNIEPPDKEILKLITFLYLKDQKELMMRLNEIHIWHKWPQLIIVNGYEHYCKVLLPEYALSNAAFVTASLVDAAATCAARHCDKKAYLLVSCNAVLSDRSKQLNTLTDMYFSNVVLLNNSNENATTAVAQIKKCFDCQSHK